MKYVCIALVGLLFSIYANAADYKEQLARACAGDNVCNFVGEIGGNQSCSSDKQEKACRALDAMSKSSN